tara:strand:+ start:4122 stop:4553 length:432 start_codon:yes stop_codon:yes gene_type:complete
MKEQIIKAISFFYQGERHIIKAGKTGKFRVPVSEVVDGNVKTRVKGLTAQQMLEHDVVKECDPTLYLDRGEKLRVFQGGDSSYLPARAQGLAEKHDEANKPKPKPKKPILNKPLTNGYNNSRDWKQETIDMYGCWPYEEDYHD